MTVVVPVRRVRRGARRLAAALLAVLLGGGIAWSTMDGEPSVPPALSAEVSAGLPTVDSSSLPAVEHPLVDIEIEPVVVGHAEPRIGAAVAVIDGRRDPSVRGDRAPPRFTV